MSEKLSTAREVEIISSSEVLSGIINEQYYRTRYPDMRDSAIDVVKHYFTVGWREGRDPNHWFSTRLYLIGHPDVALSGANPLLHYIAVGQDQGRRIWPALANRDAAAESEIVWAEFDDDYYRKRYPDIAEQSGAEHYCVFGWKEGRDPTPWFSTRAYLNRHGTVRKAAINPFVHYLLTGREADLKIEPASFVGGDTRPALLCHIDTASVDEDGILRVHGWAVALSPVQRISVSLNGTLIGQAHRSLPRADVAAAHPDYPDAPVSGFHFRRLLDEGAASGEVVASVETLGGIVRDLTIPVSVPAIRRAAHRDPAIREEVDTISLGEDGAVMVAGWAFARSGISKIEVGLGEGLAGLADTGLSRPDVGNIFPLIPSAGQSGYRFSKTLKGKFKGEHRVWLRFHAVDGRSKTRTLAVQARPVRGTAATPATRGITYFIDSPIIKGGVAEPIKGNLTLAGWAIAPGGITRIDVTIDGEPAAQAYHGIRREDIKAAFPSVPGSLLSGFAMAIPRKKLPDGEHAISVTIHGRGGERAHNSFTLHAEPDDREIGGLAATVNQIETEVKRRLIRTQTGRNGAEPSFTIVLTLAHTGPAERAKARATLTSLVAQAYPKWRVIVTTLNGNTERLAEMLSDPALAGRVVLKSTPARLPAGLVMLLRAGDVLGADALLELALARAVEPSAELLYADDRRPDPARTAVAPYFKPDWSPELLSSTNYIGRAWAATPDLLRRSRLTLPALAEAQDYATILRLAETARHITHVSKVLLTQVGHAKADDEMAALQAALTRRGEIANITSLHPGVYRVQRRLLDPEARVSVIIPTIAARGLIENTITSLRRKTDHKNIEIVCLDNINPEHPLPSMPKDRDWKHWLRANADIVVDVQEPFNWSRFNNIGAGRASGDYLLFLNDDIEVMDPAWLQALMEHAQRPEVGVAGPLLLYPDGKVQHAGIFLSHEQGRHAFRFASPNEPGPFGLAFAQRNMIAVTGACMLMRRSTFEWLSGFDEVHAVINNDLDFCFRVQRAGLQVIFTPHARLIHHELASRAEIGDVYDKTHFRAWNDFFRYGDPYINRQTSRDYDDYTPEPEPLETLFVGHPLRAHADIKRILAVKVDHIGDFITALPAFARLREHFPTAEITALVPRASMSLAASLPSIDKIIEFNFFHVRSGRGRRKLSKATLHALRKQLGALGFDLAIDLRRQPETREVLRYTGAKLLAGYDFANQFPFLDIALEWETDTKLVPKRAHVSDYLIYLVDVVADTCAPRRGPVLPNAATPETLAPTRRKARAALAKLPTIKPFAKAMLNHDKPLICIHPGVGATTRQWPPEHFAGLIDLLTERLAARCMLIGSPDEGEIAQQVLDSIEHPETTFNLIGKTAIRDLQTVLQASDLLVGNNSGPHHLAAALGVPTIGVHSGVVDAVEWGPRGDTAMAVRRRMSCSPCYLEKVTDCHRNHACLRQLYPGDVFRACLPLLLTASANQGKHEHGLYGSVHHHLHASGPRLAPVRRRAASLPGGSDGRVAYADPDRSRG